MPSYNELVQQYKKRQKETLMDTVATGLTLADEVGAGLGVIKADALLNGILAAIPFALIAITEGVKVRLGKKARRTATNDAAYRMLKTGVAMGIGAGLAGLGAPLIALPLAMGVRAAMDRVKSKRLTTRRVQTRTQRLQEINALRAARQQGQTHTEEPRIIVLPQNFTIE